MSESSADEIQIDFINELKDYIPALRDKAEKLNQAGSEAAGSDLQELHRLVHTIRGAASLVKLSNLSQVASELEGVLDEVVSDNLNFDASVFSVVSSTIDFFNAYSKETPCSDDFDKRLRSKILGELLDARKHIKKGGTKDLLSKLLDPSDVDMGQSQIDEDGLVVNETDIAFDEFDIETDDLVADEEDFADIPDMESDDPACVDATAAMPVQGHSPLGEGEDVIDGQEDLDLLQQELLEGFYQEAEDHFLDLGKALGNLEDTISEPVTLTEEFKELIRLIRRSVHTIKGAAAVIKLKNVAAWGHEFEDMLDWLFEEADTLTPETVRIIAEAADMLERHVTAPQDVDPDIVDRLRGDFRRIIGTPENQGMTSDDSAPGRPFALQADPADAACLDENLDAGVDEDEDQVFSAIPSLPVDRSKTLRVDVSKVESLVNLAGELTIAVSAFDQDMEGLGGLISEIDRARVRLKQTSRDLELGYELKSIRQLGSAPSSSQQAPMEGTGLAAEFSDFDLLELDRYSELNLIIRSLSETAVDVSTISRQLSGIYGGFDAYLSRLRVLLSELHQKSMRMRMTPMSTIVNRMRSTIRETATQLDKKVQLNIHGENIELDKMVWEKLADPLMHLLRNAVDHGIESPEDRQAAGKPDTAVVHLSAAYHGNQVVIRVSDDGAGLDHQAIRGVVGRFRPDDPVEHLSESDLDAMIFESGFTTRKSISEVSGRGVGLDVVRENIHGLKGNVRIESSASGVGTTFRITLPLTMAVMQALLFDVGGQRYATALYDIKEILRVNPEKILGGDAKTLKHKGRQFPFYNLSDVLADVVPGTPNDDADRWPIVLIVETDVWHGAVAIDRMYSQREIVIKHLGEHLRKVHGISGATVMGDGRVVPILNLEELLGVKPAGVRKDAEPKSSKIEAPLEIMVVDDSVSVRTVVSRLMQRQGWHVVTAKDGVDAIEQLRNHDPDVIVLDVEMPRMNGYEFMSAIRAQEETRETPVIMLTSRGSAKHRKKAEGLGVNGYMTKPYDDDEFIELVKRLNGIGES